MFGRTLGSLIAQAIASMGGFAVAIASVPSPHGWERTSAGVRLGHDPPEYRDQSSVKLQMSYWHMHRVHAS